MKRLALFGTLALSACAHHSQLAVSVSPTTAVPTPVSCVPADTPPAPAYPDDRQSLLKAKGPAERYQLVAAGWAPKNARLSLLEEVVKNCRTPAAR